MNIRSKEAPVSAPKMRIIRNAAKRHPAVRARRAQPPWRNFTQKLTSFALSQLNRRLLSGLLTACSIGVAAAIASPSPSQSPTVIYWEDLLPEIDRQALTQQRKALIEVPPLPDLGSFESEPTSTWLEEPTVGSQQSVSTHHQSYVELVGYPMPLQNEASRTTADTATAPDTPEAQATPFHSFLLTPELGAGLMTHAPSPNQTVRINLVSSKNSPRQPFQTPPLNATVRVRGVLRQLSQKTPRAQSSGDARQAPLPYAYELDADYWQW